MKISATYKVSYYNNFCLIGRYIAFIVDVQHQVLAILDSFFENASEIQCNQESDFGNTLHVSAYVRQFLFSTAAIICWDPTDLISVERDRILAEVTRALNSPLDTRPTFTTDYLFYTAFMFANSLLRTDAQPTRNLRALITVLVTYRARVPVNKVLQHHLDLDHPHYRWDAFCSLVDARGIVLPRSPDSECLSTSTLVGSPTIPEIGSHRLDLEKPANDTVINMMVDMNEISETTS